MELFIKRFIDLLDEVAPVSMVHTVVEQPLGAVTHDYFIQIHSRLDLVREDSPYVELEIYPYDIDKIEVLYAYTYPKESITIEEEAFVQNLKNNNGTKAEKVILLDSDKNYYYELFNEEVISVPENNNEIDEIIKNLISKISVALSLGGYKKDDEE